MFQSKSKISLVQIIENIASCICYMIYCTVSIIYNCIRLSTLPTTMREVFTLSFVIYLAIGIFSFTLTIYYLVKLILNFLANNKSEQVTIKKYGLDKNMLLFFVINIFINVPFILSGDTSNYLNTFGIQGLDVLTSLMFFVLIIFKLSYGTIVEESNKPLYHFILVNGKKPNELLKNEYGYPVFSYTLPQYYNSMVPVDLLEKQKKDKKQKRNK